MTKLNFDKIKFDYETLHEKFLAHTESDHEVFLRLYTDLENLNGQVDEGVMVEDILQMEVPTDYSIVSSKFNLVRNILSVTKMLHDVFYESYYNFKGSQDEIDSLVRASSTLHEFYDEYDLEEYACQQDIYSLTLYLRSDEREGITTLKDLEKKRGRSFLSSTTGLKVASGELALEQSHAYFYADYFASHPDCDSIDYARTYAEKGKDEFLRVVNEYDSSLMDFMLVPLE